MYVCVLHRYLRITFNDCPSISRNRRELRRAQESTSFKISIIWWPEEPDRAELNRFKPELVQTYKLAVFTLTSLQAHTLISHCSCTPGFHWNHDTAYKITFLVSCKQKRHHSSSSPHPEAAEELKPETIESPGILWRDRSARDGRRSFSQSRDNNTTENIQTNTLSCTIEIKLRSG